MPKGARLRALLAVFIGSETPSRAASPTHGRRTTRCATHPTLYALFVNMVGRSLLCSHRLRSREGGWMSQGLALTRWATLNVRSVSP